MDEQSPSQVAAPKRSLGGWVVYLWSQVLFPGRPVANPGRPPIFHLFLVLAVPAVLLYPCLKFSLLEPDESRYAQIPREMLARGDLVVPTLQGEPYLDKPPLFYWLVAGIYRLFGSYDWSARLVPALAVHACILVTYLFGRRWLGEAAAFRGALVLALSPGFLGMGRLLILDGLLSLWTTLALFSAYEATRSNRLRWGWWVLGGAACGLGVLTKGPVAPLLLIPPLWLYFWLAGPGHRPRWSEWAAFGLVMTAVAAPWYAALAQRTPSFVSYFIWEHNLKRFLVPFAHAHGVWFYVPILFATLFPGALLLFPWLRFLFSTHEENARRRPAQLGFLLLGGGWCVLFFTLSAGKLPTYILPALPPLALVLGHYLAQPRWASSRLVGQAAGFTFLLLIGFNYFALPHYAAYRSPMNRKAEVVRRCADPKTPVVCYPRNCDSVAFYLGRDDIRTFRSKDIEELRALVRSQPRTVILCTHRHSLQSLKQLLPPEVMVVDEVRLGLADIPGVPRWMMRPLAMAMGETALGLGDVAVVERLPMPLPGSRQSIPPMPPADG
jgi:hypothetical protein